MTAREIDKMKRVLVDRTGASREALEDRLREEANREAKVRRPNCDHVPMKAALDDWIGCKRCGAWLGLAN